MSAEVLSPEETAKSLGIPVEELESWLNHEIDKSCEIQMTIEIFGISWTCYASATWIAYRKQCGNCAAPPESRFCCEDHKERFINGHVVCGGIDNKCYEPIELHWIERIK